jgi:hypothetical protein
LNKKGFCCKPKYVHQFLDEEIQRWLGLALQGRGHLLKVGQFTKSMEIRVLEILNSY